MKAKKMFNILMYSHDTYGLGHIRRSMSIASQLSEPGINTLIITGSPLVGRFELPEGIDFVRIPGMIKKDNDVYLSMHIKLHPEHTLHIRKQVIKTTAKCLQPHLFIVDKEPLGLKKEVLPTLEWMRENHPQGKIILGLRDIMDAAETVRADWERRGIYEILETLYDEIWVYGKREFYDPVREYAIPETIRRKVVYTGYIPRKIPPSSTRSKMREKFGIGRDEKLVLVTLGGGGDGYRVVDALLTMLEGGPVTFKTILLTGPFMPQDKTEQIKQRVKQLNLPTHRFYRQMEKLIAAADLVVTMGGYNTLCELLSQKKAALVIPRQTPRQEQLIRAQVFKAHNLVDYIPWPELTPDILRSRILSILDAGPGGFQGLHNFQLTGTETMRQRLTYHRRRCECE